MKTVKLTIERAQAEMWLVGSFLREEPQNPADTSCLKRIRPELVASVLPEHFHEPLMRSAWLAAVDEFRETGAATVNGVCGRIGSQVCWTQLIDLHRLLLNARWYAEDLRSDGRAYAKLLAEDLIEKSHAA